MTDNKFKSVMDDLKREALRLYKSTTPVGTGHQRDSIYAKDLPGGGFEIIVDTEYVDDTNDDTGWVDNATAQFMSIAKIRLNGKIKTRSDK